MKVKKLSPKESPTVTFEELEQGQMFTYGCAVDPCIKVNATHYMYLSSGGAAYLRHVGLGLFTQLADGQLDWWVV